MHRPRPWAILTAAIAPLAVLFVLFLADVPIGRPDRLVYRYSPLAVLRLERAVVALLIGACGLAAWSAANRSGVRWRHLWSTLSVVAFLGLAVWSFLGPPKPVEQHSFNLLSPSHDGAFMLEGRGVESIRTYVSRTYFETLQNEPEQMRGRRVLSNPPGVTVAAVLVQRWVDESSMLRKMLIAVFDLRDFQDPADANRFAAAMVLAVLFTAAWAAALPLAYRLCRLWMPATTAAVVAFACVFNPATVNFTPGKDTAQLLSVVALMLCGLTAYERRRPSWACAAGAILAASSLVGLIHVWIALILAAATLWHCIHHDGGFTTWLRVCLGPAAIGFAAVCAVAYVALDWNIPRTILAVGMRYGTLQEEIITSPLYWTFLGFPMFLLFVGPLFWIELTAVRHRIPNDGVATQSDEIASLGRTLLAVTLGVMIYSYFFANNSETPRLWIPFIPLLLIGMALSRPSLRGGFHDWPWLPVVLIGLQLSVTALHWSMMDVRESEWRLFATRRFWD